MNIFYKNFLLFGLLTIQFVLQGQEIKVVDSFTKKPLDVVLISQSNSNDYVITNENGLANIEKLNRNQPLILYLLGYKTDTMDWSTLQDNNYLVLLREAIMILEPVVVSTRRWRHSNGNNPQKISRINAKYIQLNNPQTAADMLGKSGEIFIQKSQQGGGSPMIRGFSSNRLLYAIDGIRMNNAIFRSGNLHNVISLDPFSIEQSEILFGPGSVAYGSDAIGGVMSFTTKTPHLHAEKTIHAGFSQRYSSANNELASHGEIEYGNSKWAGLTSVTVNHYGDLRMGSVHERTEYPDSFYVKRTNGVDSIFMNSDPLIQKQTGFNQFHLMQKLRYRPDQFNDLQLGVHYSTTSEFGRYDRLVQTQGNLPRYSEWNYGPQQWFMANLKLSNNKKSWLADESVLRIAYQFFEESRLDRRFRSDIRRNRVENVDALSLNMDFLNSTNNKNQIEFGLESVLNNVQSNGKSINILTREKEDENPRYPNSIWLSNAIFFNISIRLNDKLLLDLGARANHFYSNSDFNTTFYPFPFNSLTTNKIGSSGSLGLLYRPFDLTSLALNISSGFRAPNIDDIAKVFDSTPGNVVVPNENLAPEQALNYEVSLSQIIGRQLRLDFTAYHIHLTNGLVRRDFIFNGMDSILYDGVLSRVQATVNAANINIYGIQGGLEWKLPYHFNLYGRLNIQSGMEELDDGTTSPTRHAPPTYGIIRLSNNLKQFKFQIDYNFSGGFNFDQMPITEIEKPHLYAKDAEGRPFSPQWSSVNLVTRFEVRQNILASISIENILDSQYRPYSSGIAGPGRNFIFSGSIKF